MANIKWDYSPLPYTRIMSLCSQSCDLHMHSLGRVYSPASLTLGFATGHSVVNGIWDNMLSMTRGKFKDGCVIRRNSFAFFDHYHENGVSQIGVTPPGLRMEIYMFLKQAEARRVIAYVTGEKNVYCYQPLITYVTCYDSSFAWSNDCKLVCSLCFIIMDSIIIRQNDDSETQGTVQCKPTYSYQRDTTVESRWQLRGGGGKKKR